MLRHLADMANWSCVVDALFADRPKAACDHRECRWQCFQSEVETADDISDICNWIKHEGIEVCIFDVLNKLHAADENDNTKMTAVMARFDTVRVETGCDVVVIHHDAKNSAPGAKKPRGASSIDSWWDWKLSINVDPEDDSLKRVFLATKAGQPLNPIAVQFHSHPAKGMRIVPVVSG